MNKRRRLSLLYVCVKTVGTLKTNNNKKSILKILIYEIGKKSCRC